MRWSTDVATVEDPGGVREVFPAPDVTAVSPSYLRTFHRPIMRGRDFLDGERDVGVAIVDEVTARALWPNANPIGAQIKFGMPGSATPFVRVVGVVGEQQGFGSDSVPGARMFGQRRKGNVYYLPGASDTLTVQRFGFGLSFVARAEAKPELLPVAIRRASQGWGDVIVRNVSSMDHALGLTESRQSSRFISSLFTLFAALGVGLAAFGVYGVVAHSVAERRRELGVRIALGATARDILHAVLRESVVVALSGVAVGLLITKYAVTHLDALVIEDDMFNAPVFASVALALVITAAIAAADPGDARHSRRPHRIAAQRLTCLHRGWIPHRRAHPAQAAGFATVVILSLALAIALNTTMYGVLDAMMHPRLDLRDPGQLYSITFFGDKKFRVDNNARDAAVASGMHSYQAITWFGASGMVGAAIERGQNFAEAGVAAVAPNFFDVVEPAAHLRPHLRRLGRPFARGAHRHHRRSGDRALSQG